MSRKLRTIIALLLLCGVGGLIFLGRWMTSGGSPLLVMPSTDITEVMSTEGKMIAVVRADDSQRASRAFRAARQTLRDVERLMSSHMTGTEIHALNNAPAGEHVALSDRTLSVLRTARDLHVESAGAFDITVRPVLEVWKQAAKEGRIPPLSKLTAARNASRWDQIELTPTGAVKSTDTAGVDLGGIAKGYGIDRAIETLKAHDVHGGLVELGGDLRCFGTRFDGRPWTVAVTDPFDPDKTLCLLRIDADTGAAVCTSGNYRRPVEIAGQRFSHILDPRTLMPTDHSPSVTVIANTATVADAWATALSVLGPPGLDSLPANEGIEAMIIMGTPERATIHTTPGFENLLVGEPPSFEPKPTSQPSEPNSPIEPVTPR
ncbi:MAG: FAD:protein FMN transferase [Planctomycetota bacterium]